MYCGAASGIFLQAEGKLALLIRLIAPAHGPPLRLIVHAGDIQHAAFIDDALLRLAAGYCAEGQRIPSRIGEFQQHAVAGLAIKCAVTAAPRLGTTVRTVSVTSTLSGIIVVSREMAFS